MSKILFHNIYLFWKTKNSYSFEYSYSNINPMLSGQWQRLRRSWTKNKLIIYI